MNLDQALSEAIVLLKKSGARFALAGGLVASLYRKEKRMTNDLDFLILSDESSLQVAKKIHKKLGFESYEIRKADLEGGPLHAIKRKSTPIWMLIGKKNDSVGLDFILPEIPWFAESLNRAELNVIKFGGNSVACLSVEDILLTKFFSLQNDRSRFADADDIKSIFLAGHDLDLLYIVEQMLKYQIRIPEMVSKWCPSSLLKTSKRVTKRVLNKH